MPGSFVNHSQTHNTMKPHFITTINVFPKKEETFLTRWLITQDIPYPCIGNIGSSIQWNNLGGLKGQFGNKAPGIGEKYYCYLLTPTGDIPESYNRTHFAGYKHQPGGYGTPEVINPGAIVYRGRSMGEMSVSFMGNPEYPDIKVMGSNSPTPGERDFIKWQIVPLLTEFIATNRDGMREQVIERIKERMRAATAEARKQLALCEEQINGFLANA